MFSFCSIWMLHFNSGGQWGIKNIPKWWHSWISRGWWREGVKLGKFEQKLFISCVHGRPGVTNGGVDLTPLTSLSIQICSDSIQRGWEESLVPLPAGFLTSADASPAPVLAPWEAFAAPSAPDGSSLCTGRSAPAARGWMTGTHPRCRSSAGR